MNLKECWDTLELKPSASEEEIKKQYKKLTVKYHPDVNKDAGAEDKFKKISAAYETLKKRNSNSNVYHQEVIMPTHIETEVTVSFKDSVVGSKKEIKYKRQAKCQKCNGEGACKINNGCRNCGGRGKTTMRQGYSVIVMQCPDCNGSNSYETCTECYGGRVVETETKISVTIPAGVQNENILRLGGMGNYAGSFIVDQYTDVFLKIKVNPDGDLYIMEQDVCSNLDLSLLEALEGCDKKVKTVFGEKTITVPGMSKNKEEVIIPKYGVNKIGNHRVILNVSYPSNILELLKKEPDGILN